MESRLCNVVGALTALSFFITVVSGFVLWLFLPVTDTGLQFARQGWLNVHVYSSIIFVVLLLGGFMAGCNYWRGIATILRGK